MLPILLAVSEACGLAGERQRDWHTGTVLDAQRNRYFAGTIGEANTATAVYRVYETFLIEGDTHAYLGQERLRWRWSRPANLSVNGPVKFAVQGRKLFVVDEDGNEHEMEILKKVLRAPDASSSRR